VRDDLGPRPGARGLAAGVAGWFGREAVLGYAPRYSALQALHEAVRWLAANGRVDVRGQSF
jgi:hypothetical protein